MSVDAHFQSSDCGLLFTTPTLITSDELLEGYSPSSPENANLRSSWHNLIDLCQNQNSMIYLRLVYPEITLGGDKKIREHLKKFSALYKHFFKFSGVEIDLTNGLLYSLTSASRQNQEEYLSSIISSISETTNLSISVRLSCLQHIHILSSKVLYNKNVSLIHLVDLKPSFLRHSAMLGLFSYFNGSDPPISAANVHHDLLLYRLDSLERIKKHVDLASAASSPVNSSAPFPVLEKRHTDPPPIASSYPTAGTSSSGSSVASIHSESLLYQRRQSYDGRPNGIQNGIHSDLQNEKPVGVATALPQLRLHQQPQRTGSPMKRRRKTGFQDEIEFDVPPSPQDDLSLKIAAWGWTILILVWVTFILGVGSIFGLWDLALGNPRSKVDNYQKYEKETGYPVPYYYSNLVVLAAVVAWVWCIVSWMGMKFFRHAKAGIDD